jgi:hypothetical protein
MDVTTHEDTTHEDHGDSSKLKQRFVSARRRIKDIDLRQTIVDNPLTAVSIGLAAGALVGLLRPKPASGRISGPLIAATGTLVYRLIRDTAIAELARYAAEVLRDAADADAGPEVHSEQWHPVGK